MGIEPLTSLNPVTYLGLLAVAAYFSFLVYVCRYLSTNFFSQLSVCFLVEVEAVGPGVPKLRSEFRIWDVWYVTTTKGLPSDSH